jgi:hypothetical protein
MITDGSEVTCSLHLQSNNDLDFYREVGSIGFYKRSSLCKQLSEYQLHKKDYSPWIYVISWRVTDPSGRAV